MKNVNKIQIAPDESYGIGQDKKSHFAEWNVLDDPSLYAKVNKLAHSTFDRSKFTVVGSPNITDDGIASGFSGSNLLTISTSGIDWTKPYKIKAVGKFTSLANSNSTLTVGNMPIIRLHDGKFEFSPATSFSQISSVGAIVDTVTPTLNVDYIIEAEFSGTNYTFRKSIDGGETFTVIGTKTTSEIVTDLTTGGTSTLGGYSGDNYRAFTGSIDLKYFEIESNGIPVFSGNKTGIDTIKPDDYTVVGTPTISVDGIASGFSGGNYLTRNVNITAGQKTWIKCSVVNGVWSSGQYQTILQLADGNNTAILGISRYSSTIRLNSYASQSHILIDNAGANIDIDTDFSTYVKCYVNSNLVIDESFTNNSNVAKMSIGSSYTDSQTWKTWAGSIDLNAFKIYVDGNLVYQPCLKIPYTLCKCNKKTVDVAYRLRVRDLLEQTGYNGYHTIDEVSENFTLPTHDFDDVIDSYENEGNYWEQRVDLTVKQRGVGAETGTEVTLLRPYANGDDYALSIPYTSKTATSFVPAADGDWFAEGKVVL